MWFPRVAGVVGVGELRATVQGTRVSFWGNENVLKLIVEMEAQLSLLKTIGLYTLNR